jgi:hypothetical protein
LLLVMKSPAVVALEHDETLRSLPRHRYCEHAGARQIRLYMSYADANTIRLRAAQASESRPTHVSWLYAIPGGWAWTICRECRSLERHTA